MSEYALVSREILPRRAPLERTLADYNGEPRSDRGSDSAMTPGVAAMHLALGGLAPG